MRVGSVPSLEICSWYSLTCASLASSSAAAASTARSGSWMSATSGLMTPSFSRMVSVCGRSDRLLSSSRHSVLRPSDASEPCRSALAAGGVRVREQTLTITQTRGRE